LKEKDYYLNFDDERLIQFTVDDFQDLYEVRGKPEKAEEWRAKLLQTEAARE